MSPDQLVAEAVAQYNQTIAEISGRLGNAAMVAANLREANAGLQKQVAELQEKLKAAESKKKQKTEKPKAEDAAN